ncbi:helix-turn-helix domain-containing protein [Deinococcus sp. QL22]|uniref:helix-turn-helix domain-containing protein n=1 Tax=Deinococcus sp. QL22 TaxID=2939437 RepID=UPI0020181E1E|nr:helix-turn-helix transcriptional regulator [Deinococcus sp. QL22]UQN08727.1 helix-turn-helix domain-containing protein [Deinococcus sp. QL22]
MRSHSAFSRPSRNHRDRGIDELSVEASGQQQIRRQKARKPSRAASTLRTVFGANLRAVRHAQALSIFDVSQATQVNPSSLAQIERSVGLDVLHALAQVVETPHTWLAQSCRTVP